MFAHNRYAERMSSSTSLADVEATIEDTGRRSEIAYERQKAAARRDHPEAPQAPEDTLRRLADYADAADKRGVTAAVPQSCFGIDGNDLMRLN